MEAPALMTWEGLNFKEIAVRSLVICVTVQPLIETSDALLFSSLTYFPSGSASPTTTSPFAPLFVENLLSYKPKTQVKTFYFIAADANLCSLHPPPNRLPQGAVDVKEVCKLYLISFG